MDTLPPVPAAWERLIEAARAALRLRGLTKESATAPLSAFAHWLRWLAWRGLDPRKAGWESVAGWRRHMEDPSLPCCGRRPGGLHIADKAAHAVRVLEMLRQDGVLAHLPPVPARPSPSVSRSPAPSVAGSFATLLAAFGEYNRARGLLRTDYSRRLRPFLNWLEGRGVNDVREVDERVLLAWRSGPGSLATHGPAAQGVTAAANTRRTRDRYLRMFFLFLYRTHRIHHDPTARMEVTRSGRTLPRGVLTEADAARLLGAVDCSHPAGLRDLAVLELLYGCGLRSAELRGLALADVRLAERELSVRGKGGKEAVVPFGDGAARALAAWLSHGRPAFVLRGGKPDRGLAFLTSAGNPLSPNGLSDLVRRHAMAAGVEGAVPHGLRHSCATHMLRAGADLRVVQRLLRHESINTTLAYTHLVTEDVREAQRKFHPRGGG